MPRRKKSDRMFQNVWDPTQEEITQWAYTPNVYTPTQDFELALTIKPDFHDLILQFAGDPSCPNQDFFLACLYVLVGDEVRWSTQTKFIPTNIINLVNKGQHMHDPNIQKWVMRSKKLMADPTQYNYDQWGLGSSFVYKA